MVWDKSFNRTRRIEISFGSRSIDLRTFNRTEELKFNVPAWIAGKRILLIVPEGIEIRMRINRMG